MMALLQDTTSYRTDLYELPIVWDAGNAPFVAVDLLREGKTRVLQHCETRFRALAIKAGDEPFS
jgi:hypothetical protein